MSPTKVRSAYRRARARCASRRPGLRRGGVPRGRAFALHPEAREETWRAPPRPRRTGRWVRTGRGRTRAACGDWENCARLRTTLPGWHALGGGLPGGKQRRGRARGQALIAARSAHLVTRRRATRCRERTEAPDDDALETTSEPAPASLRDEREFLVRECGFPGTKPRLCAFWVGGTLGSRTDPLALRYAWREGKGKTNLAADGAWELGRGDVVRVVRTRASKTSKTSKTAFANPALDGGVKLVAAEHVANAHVPGWILTSPDTLKNKKDKNESLDAWAASLRAPCEAFARRASTLLRASRGGLRHAPSPVRRPSALIPRVVSRGSGGTEKVPCRAVSL